MTTEQKMALIRIALQILGTTLTVLGYTTAADWGVFTELAMQTAGPAMMLGSAVWVLISRTKTATVKSAAALPEVVKMEITDPRMAVAAADAAPGTMITVPR